jgi:hypothetical protein
MGMAQMVDFAVRGSFYHSHIRRNDNRDVWLDQFRDLRRIEVGERKKKKFTT